MEIIIIALASVFNLIVLRFKLSRGRFVEASTDLFALILLTALFTGTDGGTSKAMVASAVISIYLYFYPPRIVINYRFWIRVIGLLLLGAIIVANL